MNLRQLLLLVSIFFLVINCSQDRKLPESYWGKWTSEEDGIYLNIERDLIELYSNDLLSRYFPLSQESSPYQVNDEGVWISSTDDVDSTKEKHIGSFSLLDSLLLITFERVTGRKIFILQRPKIFTNHNIDKIQFSASECYGTCPNYDVEINSRGEIIYHGISDCGLIGYGFSTMPKETFEQIISLVNNPKFVYNNKLLRLEAKFSADSQYFSISVTGVQNSFNVVLDSDRTPSHMRSAINHFWHILDSYSYARIDTNLVFTSRSQMEKLFHEPRTKSEYDFFTQK